MKKNEIRIGGVYAATVSGKTTRVRIDADNEAGGWDATNLATKKKIRIKSARRLRALAAPAAGCSGGTASANSPVKAPRKAKEAAAATRAKSGGDTAKRRVGILDAAARILAEAKAPMGCKEIVEQAMAAKLWTTSGRTPHATLYSAIIREIAKKGADARFEKVDRGRFRIRKSK
jgi:hypothetical protein